MSVSGSERAPTGAMSSERAASERSSTGGGEVGYDPGWTENTWLGEAPPAPPAAGPARKAGGYLRLFGFVLATLALLPLFFAARAAGGRMDRTVAGWWCACGAYCSGLTVRRVGRPLKTGGALLVNHVSWLDIMTIGSTAPVHFVSKAEVENWPFFGWIGKISNTVFIARRRAEAKAQERLLSARAKQGHLLCLFAEGTSSDGQRVLPFKSSLFSMFFDASGASTGISAQPVTIHYRPRPHLDPSFYGWWGKMPLIPHIENVVRHPGGVATVVFHEPIDLNRFSDRKALAAEAERVVREGLERVASGAAGEA